MPNVDITTWYNQSLLYCPADQHVESHGDEEALNRYTEELNAVPALPEGEGEGEGEKPILLWWTEYIFPHAHSQKSHEIECTLGNCITSMDKNLTGSPATKAFIFYGTELSAEDLPLPRRPWHEWALFHEESPKNNWMLTNEEALRWEDSNMGPVSNTVLLPCQTHPRRPSSGQIVGRTGNWGERGNNSGWGGGWGEKGKERKELFSSSPLSPCPLTLCCRLSSCLSFPPPLGLQVCVKLMVVKYPLSFA